MPRRSEEEYRALMEPVARQLLGEPNPRLSTRDELRWGSNGSMAVKGGRFYDHEQKVGGGTLAFIAHTQLMDQAAAGAWLDANYPPLTNGHDTSAAGRFTATYDYVDLDSTLISQVCRKHPKAFVQRRPDGKGGWIWSTKGLKAVPYRLPEVAAAIAAGRLVWILEGEKDVDAMRAEGRVATTNAGGVGKWKAELNQYFRGGNVVVVGHNDDVGREHAEHVARQLAPEAASVRLLRDLTAAWPECPPKGDMADYLAAGGEIGDLEALVETLPALGEVKAPAVLTGAFTAASLQGLAVPTRSWHVPGLVPARTVTLLGGDGGVGKSILGLQLAFATAAGLMWIGHAVRQGRALHLSAEDDRDELHRRSDQISTFYGTALDRAPDLTMWSLADEDAVLVTGHPGEALAPTSRWEELRRYIELDRPSLVVFDSLADVYGANENERAQVRQFVRLLRGMAMPADTAVMLLGHPSLTGLSTGSGLSGSTAWNNSVRSRMFMSAPAADDGGASEPNLRILALKKANYAQSGLEMRLRYVAGAFDLEGGEMASALDRQVAADRIDAQFLELLDAYEADERIVSDRTGRNYAPFLFAQDPRARGTMKGAFEAAMNRLFAAHKIKVAMIGRGKHERRTLVRIP